MPLLNRLTEFRASITDAQSLIAAAHQMDAAGVPLWSQTDTRTITQAAFLKIFIAWETFLEWSLIDYMLGEPSALGNVLIRYAAPADESHAGRILVGTQKYADYSNPEIVRRLAKLFLSNGDPYETIISGIQTPLFDLKTMRNAAAHLSSTTSAHLDALASRILGPPRANVTVYELITAIDPNSPAGSTVLETYVVQLESAAHSIVHA
jgi:hypothetical protein